MSLLAVAGCCAPAALEIETAPFEKLSQYGLFRGDGAAHQPAPGVIPYDLNSALFSDYTSKYRFIKLPPGTQATYSAKEVFDFPVGTVIAKTFAAQRDAREPAKGQRLIETRILKREPDGWVGLPYIWNDAQTEATLEVAGGTVDVQWIHTDGQIRTNNYIIPNANQCKGCHKQGDALTPIGPRARHLNRDYAYVSGTDNQLAYWSEHGVLTGAPAPAGAPKSPVWDDPTTGTLDVRARAWLEINCAHCHNPEGPARNSGLDLTAAHQNSTALGLFKTPAAAGRGSGGREFDIVPGQPDRSILVYRIASSDAGIMMPELGKRLVHEEGLALVRAWIAEMKEPTKPRAAPRPTASSIGQGSRPEGAIDGNRFSAVPSSVWKGRQGDVSWWWQVEFPEPQSLGAILQIHGDHEYALRNAPSRYVWQVSQDGTTWDSLTETATSDERRTFRIHRLGHARRVRWLRLAINSAMGDHPTIREVEFFAEPKAEIPFPPWAVVVSTTGSARVPGEGAAAFRKLARSCDNGKDMQFQNVWLGDFHENFVTAEPRPLCAFLSGNFIDWCQQNREHWRGTAQILGAGRLPLWASCGGAQGLAIVAETGVDRPWDCPQCRDPAHPKLPIYTHIAGSVVRKCGDYSGCVFERGPYTVVQIGADPVFQGLPREFRVMESHCGQIGWAPRGWELIATMDEGGKTKTQCLRLKDRPVYAAQFHIEMDGTPDSSRKIMSNFLTLSRRAATP